MLTLTGVMDAPSGQRHQIRLLTTAVSAEGAVKKHPRNPLVRPHDAGVAQARLFKSLLRLLL